MSLARSTLPMPSIPSHRSNAGGITGTLRSAWIAYRREAQVKNSVREAIAALSAMNDSDLADIGLSRGRIAEAVTSGRRY